ncbi:MAG: hypothetical protein JW753_01345 [Dehalococcoidia bacterium]|nr:hypothetical protein [Dehalococcoidia bacterium]
MPALGEKAQRAWTEVRESWEMVVEIEKESLKLAQSETERSYYSIMDRLRNRKD